MVDQSHDVDGARIKVENLQKHFPISKSVFRKATDFVHAVDGLSFSIAPVRAWAWWGSPVAARAPPGRCW